MDIISYTDFNSILKDHFLVYRIFDSYQIIYDFKVTFATREQIKQLSSDPKNGTVIYHDTEYYDYRKNISVIINFVYISWAEIQELFNRINKLKAIL